MRNITFSIVLIVFIFIGCTESPHKNEPEPTVLNSVVIISEIVSNNVATFSDAYGDFDDYVKIYNPQDTSVNLEGFGLSDEFDVIKYEFVSSIDADSTLLIWCDAESEEGFYHADFRISADGEWLGLYDNSMTLIDSVTVPFLPEDMAYIRIDDTWIISTPTAGH